MAANIKWALSLGIVAGPYMALADSPWVTMSIPVPTSAAFLPWAKQYALDAVADVPAGYQAVYYFSADGSDSSGDGSVQRPFKSIAKANQILDGGSGGVALLFRTGDTFYGADGLHVTKANTKIGSWKSIFGATRKPRLTRFEPQIAPSAWKSTAIAGVYQVPVASDVAWIRFFQDNDTVFRKETTLVDCQNVQGSWYWANGTLTVHNFNNLPLDSTAQRIDYVLKNKSEGILVEDVSKVWIDGLIIEGFGAGTSGDYSYNGYGIETRCLDDRRTVVTNCETYYNGRHSITKVTPGGGATLRVARLLLLVVAWVG